MPLLLLVAAQGFFRAVTVAIAIAVINPWSIIVIIVLSAAVYYTVDLGTRALIESQKLDEQSRMPIFDSISLAFTGIVPMRTSGRIDFFRKDFVNQLKFSTNASFCQVIASRWLSVRLDLLFAIFISLVAFFLVTLKGHVESSHLVVSLQISIDAIFLFSLTFRMYAEFESKIGSLQRMVAYTKLEEEDKLEKPGDEELERNMWPTEGKIEFEEATLRNSYDSDPILKNMSFKVQPGMLVGVVGVQGSGKSSVHQALLRLTELQGGRMMLDGVDIKTVGLHLLRKSISYIPQSPLCVRGSIRQMIDPFNESTEAQINAVLREVKMYEKIYSLSQNLNTCVAEGNNLFTPGQKQLLCLARAIIRKVKVLILDEATDTIDPETDNLIHRTLRERFRNSTVFIIAHRLSSIIDADRILVLKKGSLQEYSHPYKLFVEHEGDPTITNIKG